MSTFLVLRVLSTKDRTSLSNYALATNMYSTRYSANWVTLSHLYRAHSNSWAHLFERLHMLIYTLWLYVISYFEWSPALTVSSICLSVLSMLSSAPKKIKPPNDAEFVKRAAGRGPKAFLWSYDDDKAW